VLKSKPFLIGLGCGLIAGAIFLQLMISSGEIKNKTSVIVADALTQEQLQAEAGRLNMKVIPKENLSYTQQQIDEIKQKAAAEEKSKAANAAPVKEKILRTVHIPNPMDATSVANVLVTAQVIPESAQLLNLLIEQKLTEKIRYGTYTFEDQTDVKEVLRKITTSP
jgi:hypothetical protein